MAVRIALAVLAAALLAPASAGAVYRDFRSPTGKLGCAFGFFVSVQNVRLF